MVEVEVEVEEVSDLGQVKSCAIGVKILFSEEEASHKIANCPYQSTARSDWWKTKMNKKSKHSTDPEENC